MYEYDPFQQLKYDYYPIENESIVTNVPIAAMITGYARIHMHKLITHMINEGANIYYTDTDSIVIDRKVPENWEGNEIGKLKNEFPNDKILEGYFVAPKLYGISLESGKKVVKAKGIKQLSYESLIDIYNNESVSVNEQRSKKKDLISPIVFYNSNITISLTNLKRIPLYDNSGNWVDSEPYNINKLKKKEEKSRNDI